MVGAVGVGWRRVACVRPKAPRHGPVPRSSRCRRRRGSIRSPSGGEAATYKAAGTSERRRKPAKSSGGAFRAKKAMRATLEWQGSDAGGFPVAGRPRSWRCGTGGGATRRGKSLRWSDLSDEMTGLRCHKPKTPVGRRGESLFYLRTDRVGQSPRRPGFSCPERGRTIHQPEAGTPTGAPTRPRSTLRAHIEVKGARWHPDGTT